MKKHLAIMTAARRLYLPLPLSKTCLTILLILFTFSLSHAALLRLSHAKGIVEEAGGLEGVVRQEVDLYSGGDFGTSVRSGCQGSDCGGVGFDESSDDNQAQDPVVQQSGGSSSESSSSNSGGTVVVAGGGSSTSSGGGGGTASDQTVDDRQTIDECRGPLKRMLVTLVVELTIELIIWILIVVLSLTRITRAGYLIIAIIRAVYVIPVIIINIGIVFFGPGDNAGCLADVLEVRLAYVALILYAVFALLNVVLWTVTRKQYYPDEKV